MVKHDRRQLPNDINRNHVSNLEIKFSFKIYRIVNVQIQATKKKKKRKTIKVVSQLERKLMMISNDESVSNESIYDYTEICVIMM